MRLEEEIHQQHFRSEWQKAMINLIFTYGWGNRQLKALLKPFGLSPQQYNVLRILNGQYPNPISTSDISRRMLDKASDASRIVDRMEKKGWVEKKPCKADRRLVDVVISFKGKQLVDELEQLNPRLDGILQKLSESEAKQLNQLLDKLRS